MRCLSVEHVWVQKKETVYRATMIEYGIEGRGGVAGGVVVRGALSLVDGQDVLDAGFDRGERKRRALGPEWVVSRVKPKVRFSRGNDAPADLFGAGGE